MDRRTFNSALLSSAASAVGDSGIVAAVARSVLYQSVGAALTWWDVDVDAATLTPRASVELPSNIQYVWPHPSRQYLYVSTSDAASGNAPSPGKVHRLCALRVDASGALSMHGEPAVLPQRPIHNSVDTNGEYALTCYNNPSNLTIHCINSDGTLGAQVQQEAKLDCGIFAHQILPMPGNRAVIMVTRGNKPEGNKSEDPGALKIYKFQAGRLTAHANLLVGGRRGLGYGPRHLDFHPTQPWAYVSVESQNELHMHRIEDDSLSPEPLYKIRSTIGTYDISFPQMAGAIHVHPNGRTVYMANRASAVVDFKGKKVFRGGENNIVVFSIDQTTGKPTIIQIEDPQSFHIRTFSIDPSGRMMVAASILDMSVRDNDDVRYVPAALTVFRIGEDGKLYLARKYEVELGGKFQWWAGLIRMV